METKALPNCPVETTLMLICDKWKVLVLRDLLSGAKRFGQLKKSLSGVSQKVLTVQLRQVEEDGLLTRTVYAEVPPRVEYALTELGRSLAPCWTPCAPGGNGIRRGRGEKKRGQPRFFIWLTAFRCACSRRFCHPAPRTFRCPARRDDRPGPGRRPVLPPGRR